MFRVALFTIAEIQKQPKCPSTDEWIKMSTHTHTCACAHTHTMEYYSAIKNEICSNMNGPRDQLGKISQKEKDKLPHSSTYR